MFGPKKNKNQDQDAQQAAEQKEILQEKKEDQKINEELSKLETILTSDGLLSLVYDDHDGRPTLSKLESLQYVIKNYQNSSFQKPKNAFVKITQSNFAPEQGNPIEKAIENDETANEQKITDLLIIEKSHKKEIDSLISELDLATKEAYKELENLVQNQFSGDEKAVQDLKSKINSFRNNRIGAVIDLTKSIIYNVEADWNPGMIAEFIKKDIYDNGQKWSDDDQKPTGEELKLFLNHDNSFFIEEAKKASGETIVSWIQKIINQIRIHNGELLKNVEALSDQDTDKKFTKSIQVLQESDEKIAGIFTKSQVEIIDFVKTNFTKLEALQTPIFDEVKAMVQTKISSEAISKAIKSIEQNIVERDGLIVKLAFLAQNKEIAVKSNLENIEYIDSKCTECGVNHAVDFKAFERLANDSLMKKFNDFLTKKYKHFLHGKNYSSFYLIQRKYTFSQYAAFIATEGGVIGDLQDLYSIMEKDRIQTMMQKIVGQISLGYGPEEILGVYFRLLEIMTAQLIVLKTIAIHMDIVDKVEKFALEKTPEYMRIFVWDRYLDNQIISVYKEVDKLYYQNPEDQNLKYLFHELNRRAIIRHPLVPLFNVELSKPSPVVEKQQNVAQQQVTTEPKQVQKIINEPVNTTTVVTQYVLDQDHDLITVKTWLNGGQIPSLSKTEIQQDNPFAFTFGHINAQDFETEWNFEDQNAPADYDREKLFVDSLPTKIVDFVFEEETNKFEFGELSPSNFETKWGDFGKYIPYNFTFGKLSPDAFETNWGQFSQGEYQNFKFGEIAPSSFQTKWGEFRGSKPETSHYDFIFGGLEASKFDAKWSDFVQPIQAPAKQDHVEETQPFAFGQIAASKFAVDWGKFYRYPFPPEFVDNTVVPLKGSESQIPTKESGEFEFSGIEPNSFQVNWGPFYRHQFAAGKQGQNYEPQRQTPVLEKQPQGDFSFGHIEPSKFDLQWGTFYRYPFLKDIVNDDEKQPTLEEQSEKVVEQHGDVKPEKNEKPFTFGDIDPSKFNLQWGPFYHYEFTGGKTPDTIQKVQQDVGRKPDFLEVSVENFTFGSLDEQPLDIKWGKFYHHEFAPLGEENSEQLVSDHDKLLITEEIPEAESYVEWLSQKAGDREDFAEKWDGMYAKIWEHDSKNIVERTIGQIKKEPFFFDDPLENSFEVDWGTFYKSRFVDEIAHHDGETEEFVFGEITPSEFTQDWGEFMDQKEHELPELPKETRVIIPEQEGKIFETFFNDLKIGEKQITYKIIGLKPMGAAGIKLLEMIAQSKQEAEKMGIKFTSPKSEVVKKTKASTSKKTTAKTKKVKK